MVNTRAIRNTQAQLIVLQAARIAVLEARVDVYIKQVAKLESDLKQLQIRNIPGWKAKVNA